MLHDYVIIQAAIVARSDGSTRFTQAAFLFVWDEAHAVDTAR